MLTLHTAPRWLRGIYVFKVWIQAGSDFYVAYCSQVVAWGFVRRGVRQTYLSEV
jgi:hypothetical protein